MAPERPSTPAWMGWTALAAHADVSSDTLRRWSRLPGFPVVSYPTSRRPRISVALFDQWLAAQTAAARAPGVDAVLNAIRATRKRA